MEAKLPYERVPVASLKFDGRNARKHDKKNLKAIKDSLTKFGQQKPIVVTKDNVVIAGNGTLAAAKELGWETIDISRSQLTKDEATAYGLADNRSAELAGWDESILGDLLSELDGLDWDLEGLGWDAADLDALVHSGENLKDENAADDFEGDLYSKKIEAPIYRPTGPKPEIKELFDTTKAKELIKKLELSELPKAEKEFLKFAAYRHVVFNYQNIAEYYAHAEKGTQELFEDSALVIIDFNKSIENGFIQLSKEIAESYIEETADDDA